MEIDGRELQGDEAVTRALPEWIAKHDDEAIPQRVQLRIYTRANGMCVKCGRPLRKGHWACDHITALINGGQHRESNLQALCISPCHSDKNKQDVAEKAATYRVRLKETGIKKSRNPMPGSKASGIRKRMNGDVERW